MQLLLYCAFYASEEADLVVVVLGFGCMTAGGADATPLFHLFPCADHVSTQSVV